MPRKAAQSLSERAGRAISKRPATDTPTRASKRARATSRKSYAEPETDSDADSNAKDPQEDSGSVDASDFEAQSAKEASSESESEADAAMKSLFQRRPHQEAGHRKRTLTRKSFGSMVQNLNPGHN